MPRNCPPPFPPYRPPFMPRPEPFTPMPCRCPPPDPITWIKVRLAAISGVIPKEASPDNLLADRRWVVGQTGGKADKAPDPTAGNLAALDAQGNPVDSGKKPSDFQAKLTFDTTPTAGSQNPVTSEGIKSAIATAAATNTANFLGTYSYVTDLGFTQPSSAADVDNAAIATALGGLAFAQTPTNNDYVFVSINYTPTTDVDEFRRFKFNDTPGTWAYEYTLNNSSFTAEQWAAISSGITSGLVAKLGALPTAEALAQALAGKQSKITASGILKGDGAGGVSAATAGTDFQAPLSQTQLDNIAAVPNKANDADVVHKTGDETVGGTKVFTGAADFYDLTISHPQGQGYIRIYALANENRVRIEFSDAVSGSQGALLLPVLGGYGGVTLAAIENIAPDAFAMLYDGATVDLNTLYCYQGRLYRCILGYTFQSGDSYPSNDATHWTPATVEDVLAALRTAIAGKAARAANPTAGNLAALDSNGNPTDSLIPATNVATKAMIDANNTTFSNAVLSVGLGIDPETIAEINELVDTAHDLPVTGATTVGALLLALAAAIAALKRDKANASDLPYALVAKTIENGAVTLDDRASNAVEISAALSPNTLTVNFPTATSGKVRDFALRLNIASGVTAPELVLPQGVVCENADGEVPEISDGGTGGSSTILYFSETENNGTTAKFLLKGETLAAITQA